MSLIPIVEEKLPHDFTLTSTARGLRRDECDERGQHDWVRWEYIYLSVSRTETITYRSWSIACKNCLDHHYGRFNQYREVIKREKRVPKK